MHGAPSVTAPAKPHLARRKPATSSCVVGDIVPGESEDIRFERTTIGRTWWMTLNGCKAAAG